MPNKDNGQQVTQTRNQALEGINKSQPLPTPNMSKIAEQFDVWKGIASPITPRKK